MAERPGHSGPIIGSFQDSHWTRFKIGKGDFFVRGNATNPVAAQQVAFAKKRIESLELVRDQSGVPLAKSDQYREGAIKINYDEAQDRYKVIIQVPMEEHEVEKGDFDSWTESKSEVTLHLGFDCNFTDGEYAGVLYALRSFSLRPPFMPLFFKTVIPRWAGQWFRSSECSDMMVADPKYPGPCEDPWPGDKPWPLGCIYDYQDDGSVKVELWEQLSPAHTSMFYDPDWELINPSGPTAGTNAWLIPGNVGHQWAAGNWFLDFVYPNAIPIDEFDEAIYYCCYRPAYYNYGYIYKSGYGTPDGGGMLFISRDYSVTSNGDYLAGRFQWHYHDSGRPHGDTFEIEFGHENVGDHCHYSAPFTTYYACDWDTPWGHADAGIYGYDWMFGSHAAASMGHFGLQFNGYEHNFGSKISNHCYFTTFDHATGAFMLAIPEVGADNHLPCERIWYKEIGWHPSGNNPGHLSGCPNAMEFPWRTTSFWRNMGDCGESNYPCGDGTCHRCITGCQWWEGVRECKPPEDGWSKEAVWVSGPQGGDGYYVIHEWPGGDYFAPKEARWVHPRVFVTGGLTIACWTPTRPGVTASDDKITEAHVFVPALGVWDAYYDFYKGQLDSGGVPVYQDDGSRAKLPRGEIMEPVSTPFFYDTVLLRRTTTHYFDLVQKGDPNKDGLPIVMPFKND